MESNLRRLVRVVVLTVPAIALATLSGCNLGEWKDSYRNVNLLADRSFTLASFADTYIADATPDFDYVNFEEIADSAAYGETTGLPADPGPVYRLELVNLFPNGDFEATGLGATPDNWTLDGGVVLRGDNTAGLAITGMSAEFEVASRNAAYFDLRTHLLDNMVYPGSYHLNLQVRREATDTYINYDYGSLTLSHLAQDNIAWETNPDPDNTALDPEDFPNDSNNDVVNIFSVADDPEHYFYLGAPDLADPVLGQKGHVDNIRIGRFDIFPHVALSLETTGPDGTLPFLPGTYRFSVWVKSEIDSQVTPTTANAFRPGQISIAINDTWQPVGIDDSAGGWTTDEWVQVSCEQLIYQNDLLDSTPITLRLSVSSLGDPRVGRILVAVPALELIID